jgi:hypothetical protein
VDYTKELNKGSAPGCPYEEVDMDNPIPLVNEKRKHGICGLGPHA